MATLWTLAPLFALLVFASGSPLYETGFSWDEGDYQDHWDGGHSEDHESWGGQDHYGSSHDVLSGGDHSFDGYDEGGASQDDGGASEETSDDEAIREVFNYNGFDDSQYGGYSEDESYGGLDEGYSEDESYGGLDGGYSEDESAREGYDYEAGFDGSQYGDESFDEGLSHGVDDEFDGYDSEEGDGYFGSDNEDDNGSSYFDEK